MDLLAVHTRGSVRVNLTPSSTSGIICIIQLDYHNFVITASVSHDKGAMLILVHVNDYVENKNDEDNRADDYD